MSCFSSRVFVLLLVAGVCALSGGCVPRRDDRVRLRYAIWGSVRQTQVEEQIVAEFERLHPGIDVELFPVSSGYQEKIQATMVGGTTADVLMVDYMIYGDWAERGALADVSAVVRSLNATDEFMPVALDVFRLDQRYFALPINSGAMVMFCNLDALAAAGITLPRQGMTWADFATLGPKLSRRSGNRNAPTDYLCVIPPPTALLAAFGVQLFDDPRAPTRVTVMGPAAIAAVEFYRQLVAEGWTAPANEVLDSGANQLFRDGMVAFLFTGRYSTTEFSGKTAFEWDIAPMPASPGARALVGGTGLAISAHTQLPGVARDFLRFYASEAAVRIAVDGGRIVPTTRRFAYGEHFLAQSPPASVRLFSELEEEGAGAPLLYGSGQREVHDILYRRLEQSLAEPGRHAQEIVAGIETDLKRWLQRRQERSRQ